MSEAASLKMLVIIPALNEEGSVAHVVARVRQQIPGVDVLVVNDGSWDATADRAEAAGAMVLHMPYNVGIGASVQAGFQFAEKRGYDVVIRNDGDGQHDPAEISRMLAALAADQADIVIGSRYIENRGYVASPMRRLGSVILARLISVIVRQRVTDPTSGFIVCNRHATQLCAQLYPHDYPEPESIVLLHRAGIRLLEMPVTMQPRIAGQSSITTLRSAYYMIKVILAILVDVLRPAPVIQSH
ncbi:MAG: glycosyltransferase family 2 protein [Chloroflexi bacterium]|nr:glycosyltransferase family 2 protein [Chloroflexota bacterium]MCC6896832.1 glycosyltransferase family 2 protein [Anaerolineae bacterium]